jgi:hypothetical protein
VYWSGHGGGGEGSEDDESDCELHTVRVAECQVAECLMGEMYVDESMCNYVVRMEMMKNNLEDERARYLRPSRRIDAEQVSNSISYCVS